MMQTQQPMQMVPVQQQGGVMMQPMQMQTANGVQMVMVPVQQQQMIGMQPQQMGATTVVVQQPMQPMMQQQVMQPMQPMQQGMTTGPGEGPGTMQGQTSTQPIQQQQTTVVVHQPAVYDDPCCLYTFGVFGFLIPLVGFIGMCVYNCGNGLPPRQKSAFNCMVVATIVGLILDIIISTTSSGDTTDSTDTYN